MRFKLVIALVVIASLIGAVAALVTAQGLREHTPDPTELGEPDGTVIADLPEIDRADFIVHSTEDRFEDAYKKLGTYLKATYPLSVPGGPLLFALADVDLPEEMQPAKRTTVEVLKRYSPRRIILVSHQGDVWYDSIAAWNDNLAGVSERQIADLRKAGRVVKEWFPDSEVVLYYGRLENANKVRFSPLKADGAD